MLAVTQAANGSTLSLILLSSTTFKLGLNCIYSMIRYGGVASYIVRAGARHCQLLASSLLHACHPAARTHTPRRHAQHRPRRPPPTPSLLLSRWPPSTRRPWRAASATACPATTPHPCCRALSPSPGPGDRCRQTRPPRTGCWGS
jgi:hypothetical protein